MPVLALRACRCPFGSRLPPSARVRHRCPVPAAGGRPGGRGARLCVRANVAPWAGRWWFRGSFRFGVDDGCMHARLRRTAIFVLAPDGLRS